MHHHGAVFADRVQHDWPFALGGCLPHNVDAFGLQSLEVAESACSTWAVCGHGLAPSAMGPGTWATTASMTASTNDPRWTNRDDQLSLRRRRTAFALHDNLFEEAQQLGPAEPKGP